MMGYAPCRPSRWSRTWTPSSAGCDDDGVAVLLAGMLAPPNLGRTYGEAFEAVFARVAERHDVPLYPFFLEGVAGDPQLNQPDGIHPTAEGIAIIVERILPIVTDWLDRAG